MILRILEEEVPYNGRKWALDVGADPYISVIFMQDGSPWPNGWMGTRNWNDKHTRMKLIKILFDKVKHK